jgi:hypothetical protein
MLVEDRCSFFRTPDFRAWEPAEQRGSVLAGRAHKLDISKLDSLALAAARRQPSVPLKPLAIMKVLCGRPYVDGARVWTCRLPRANRSAGQSAGIARLAGLAAAIFSRQFQTSPANSGLIGGRARADVHATLAGLRGPR